MYQSMHPAAEFIAVSHVKQLNESAGHYFFSMGAMRYFNCRVGTSAIALNDMAFFVTSERESASHARLYTARMMPLSGPNRGRVFVLTLTSFQQFRTSAAAWTAIDAFCAGCQ